LSSVQKFVQIRSKTKFFWRTQFDLFFEFWVHFVLFRVQYMVLSQDMAQFRNPLWSCPPPPSGI